MRISLPALSLVVLVGPSGSGKSTFARRLFLPTEVVSSDACRGLVSDDENDQAATNDAFDLLHAIVAKRLTRGRLTVVDATNVQPESRAPLVALARRHHVLPVAVVLALPERLCHERNQGRPDRAFGPHVVARQHAQMRRSLRYLKREGFRQVVVIHRPEDLDAATVERARLWVDRRDHRGPFDVIGDVHGCATELEMLLDRLGYRPTPIAEPEPLWGETVRVHPEGRTAVFVGDLVDRGPRVLDAVRIVRAMVRHGSALCVPGNHDEKLARKLAGRDVRVAHGLAESLAEIDALPAEGRERFASSLREFLDGLVSHYVLDEGRLVVAHAGLKASMQGRASTAVREFALYGKTTGETDELGLPVRLDWAGDYRGSAIVVYGHTPVGQPQWLNGTINVDTGCVFGGRLTALRYPEKEIVSVPAGRVYCEPARPFLPVPDAATDDSVAPTAQQVHDEVLDVADVLGKRPIETRLHRSMMIQAAHAAAALEVMSRFAVDPRWLITLPPTMSPCATSTRPGLLEHPAEAFAYYREQGVAEVVCQEKHMGSRAIAVVCRDAGVARRRFGVAGGEAGIVVTRTGRRFFTDDALERGFVDRLAAALAAAGTWEALATDWVCLDGELMPWSAKAQELIRSQYAAVGAAGSASLPPALAALEAAAGRLTDADGGAVAAARERFVRRHEAVGRYVAAYRRYCWPVASLDDLKFAPFFVLATEVSVPLDRDHVWHMETLARLCAADPGVLRATPYRTVDLTDAASEAAGIAWWEELTDRGGEGMVVKPRQVVAIGPRGPVQPAVKCRGREYLRIIYGPDYDEERHLDRLRRRGLGRKRSLALREFALGIEALERFVRREPLRRVHECVFGVLALESEPVDPRL